MSRKKSDLPKTAKLGKTGWWEHFSNKPRQGELFVRTSGGSVLLGQTLKLFGRKPRDPKTGVSG